MVGNADAVEMPASVEINQFRYRELPVRIVTVDVEITERGFYVIGPRRITHRRRGPGRGLRLRRESFSRLSAFTFLQNHFRDSYGGIGLADLAKVFPPLAPQPGIMLESMFHPIQHHARLLSH